MPITINDVRREVLVGLSRIRIHDSDTIEVADGDHPMQPSVKEGIVTGPGGGGTVERIPKWSGVGNELVDSAFQHLTLTNPPDLENTHEFRTLTGSAFSMRIKPGSPPSGQSGKVLMIEGGDASDAAINEDGGQVRIRGGERIGSGLRGNVNITATQIVLTGEIVLGNNTSTTGSAGSGTSMTSSADTEIHFDIQGTEYFRIEAAQLTAATELDMSGNDITGYAPKESHIDLFALAAEHAFS